MMNMEPTDVFAGLPDLCDDDPGPLVCPECLVEGLVVSRLFYASNTARHVCVVHGPVVTAESLHAIIPALTRKEGPHG